MNVSGNESCYFTQKKKKKREEEEKDEATNQDSAFQKHICDFFVFCFLLYLHVLLALLS